MAINTLHQSCTDSTTTYKLPWHG